MRKDLSNQTFGNWHVISFSHIDPNQEECMWKCKCICGKEKAVRGSSLRNGSSTSCGCERVKAIVLSIFKHGHCIHGKRSREARAYHNAEMRCTDKTSRWYHRYGGRGIEFKFTSFREFYEHIGPCPDGYQIDRINNNGHYEIGNVRWVTPSQNTANRG